MPLGPENCSLVGGNPRSHVPEGLGCAALLPLVQANFAQQETGLRSVSLQCELSQGPLSWKGGLAPGRECPCEGEALE